MRHSFDNFVHGFLHVDHGIFYTAKALLKNPGRMLRNYLQGQRVKYVNPFTFVLLMGGLSAILLPKLHFQSLIVDIGLISNKAVDQAVWTSSLKHFSVRLLLSIPLYSIVTKCFYYKNYNFSEHLIANTFIRAELCIVMLVFSPLDALLHPVDTHGIFKSVIVLLMMLYVAWAYAGLFNGRVNFLSLAKGSVVSVVCIAVEIIFLNMIILKKFPF